jgi:hypothetical protein
MALASQMFPRQSRANTCGYGPIWVGLGHRQAAVA